jgi:prefoldin subunit 5
LLLEEKKKSVDDAIRLLDERKKEVETHYANLWQAAESVFQERSAELQQAIQDKTDKLDALTKQ